MEIIRNTSNAIGGKVVRVEGERDVGVSEALGLWTGHLVFKLLQISETGPDHSIGMYNRVPVVYGKTEQKSTEKESSGT